MTEADRALCAERLKSKIARARDMFESAIEEVCLDPDEARLDANIDNFTRACARYAGLLKVAGNLADIPSVPEEGA